MSTLGTTFQADTQRLAMLDKIDADFKRRVVVLAEGETASFGPDNRLAIGTHATLMLTFVPAWLPWADPGSSDAPPCMIQLGTTLAPGACFQLAVGRELDALYLSSANTKTVKIAADCSDGRRLILAFAGSTAHVLMFGDRSQSAVCDTTVPFRLGDAKGLPPVLQLGSDSGNSAGAPFVGAVSSVMLLDQALADEVRSSSLTRGWMKHGSAGFFAGLGLEENRTLASALVGVLFQGGNRLDFDFCSRGVFWPTAPKLDRWALQDSTVQPQQVDVPNVSRQKQGIYTSACIYCIARIDGEPWLCGDAGQRFRLAYLGGSRYHAESADERVLADGTRARLAATLEFETPERIRITTDGRWSNSVQHVFPLLVAPPNTVLCDRNGHAMSDAVQWPDDPIVLERVPAHYDLTVGAKEPMQQQQSFKDAFSKRLNQIGMSSTGWNLTQMDAPLNLANCKGAKRATEFYLLQQPLDTSHFYRVEIGIGVPYYCYTAAPNQTDGGSTSRMYRSADDYANQESTSYGANLGLGDKKLINLSFENSTGYKQNESAEHTIAVHHTTTLRYVVMLDKRWLELNQKFVAEVLQAADAVLAGKTDPSPFERVFWAWGTHYPNAITYGERTYSLSVMDEAALGDMAESGTNISAGLMVPLPQGLNVGGDIAKKTHTERGHQSTFREQTDLSVQVGSHEDPSPVLLDLRPLTDLLQPPYVLDERVRKVLPHVRAALERYLQDALAGPVSDGLTLYQARLLSIRNLSLTNPCFVLGRAFLAGVAAVGDWHIVLPADPAVRNSAQVRIWASAADPDAENVASDSEGGLLRIEPGATYQPAPGIWGRSATIGIPRNRTDIVPAIGWTGRVVLSYHNQARLETQIEKESSFSAFAPGAAPAVFMVDAPPSVIQARERQYAAPPAFTFFGQDWIDVDAFGRAATDAAPGPTQFFTDAFEGYVLREKLKLASLPEGAAFHTSSFTAAGLEVRFGVRKIDPMELFENAAGYAIPRS